MPSEGSAYLRSQGCGQAIPAARRLGVGQVGRPVCVKLSGGSTPLGGKRIYEKTGSRFLRSHNVWNNGLRLDDVVFIPSSVRKRMESTSVEPGDVL